MNIEHRCPDCHTRLLQVVAVPVGLKDSSLVRVAKLVKIKGGFTGGPMFYCPNDERLWEPETRYDEVFAGKHQGDPK